MEPNYEVLGAQIVRELMGEAPIVGAGPQLDAQAGISAAAELISRGVNTYQAKEDAKKSAAAQQVATANALSADISWANAEVMLETANNSKDPQKIMAAQSLASTAAAGAMSAGMSLSTEAAAKRISAANEMAKQAAEKSYANPKNVGLAAAMRAWQKVSAAAMQQTSQLPGGSNALELARLSGGGGGFLDAMKKKYAGIPLGGWLIGVPVTGGLIALIVKALRRRK
jgi:hypothetical protein